jgi:uncharacterized protein
MSRVALVAFQVRHIVRWISLAVVFCASTTQALAQSFDCREASRPIEHAICNDKAVADMDVELSSKYQEAMAKRATNRLELASGERRWIARRDAQCLPYINDFAKLDDCLRAAYGARLSAVASGDFLSDIRRPETRSAAKIVDRGMRSAAAVPARLSSVIVQNLADAASQQALYDMAQYEAWGTPRFDDVTRVWTVEFHGRPSSPRHPSKANFQSRFYAFVYDDTSRTQVTCPGLYGVGAAIPSKDLPAEVRDFVAMGDSAMDLYCANLSGNGRKDYLLVTQNQKDTRRTLQILLRGPDGELRSVVRNPNVVQPPFDDGMGGYAIIARRNRFEVMNTSAGSGGGDTYVFYFQYSPHERIWFLTRAEKVLTGYAHSSDDDPYTELPKDFGRITIEDFDLQRFNY